MKKKYKNFTILKHRTCKVKLTFGVLPSRQLELFFDSAFELAGDSFPDGTCL